MKSLIFLLVITLSTMFGQDNNWSQNELVKYAFEYVEEPPPVVYFVAVDTSYHDRTYQFGHSVWDGDDYVNNWEKVPSGIYYVAAYNYYDDDNIVMSDIMLASYMESDTTGTWFVTGSMPAPTRPTNIYPAQADTVGWVDGTLIFEPGEFNVVFHVQLAPDSTYTELIIDDIFGFVDGEWTGYDGDLTIFEPIPEDTTEVTYLVVDLLDYSTQYWWRVRAWNESGWSDWSGN